MIRDGYGDIPRQDRHHVTCPNRPPPPRPGRNPGLALSRFGPGDIEAYRDLFRVGGTGCGSATCADDAQLVDLPAMGARMPCPRRAGQPSGLLSPFPPEAGRDRYSGLVSRDRVGWDAG
jgi:hypothetical protein